MPKIYNLTDTWNDGATVFDAIKIDVTDTASAAGSKLIDLQVGGASKFKVDKDGNLTTSGDITGLDQVDNTSDVDKPVSVLQQAALALKGDFFADGTVPMTGDLEVQANVNTTGAYQKDGSTILNFDSALYNTSVGVGALSDASLTGVNNAGIGFNTLSNNGLGNNNVGIGYAALNDNTSGSGNIGVGTLALNDNTVGTYNTAIGYQSLRFNTDGDYNCGIVREALYSNTTGIYNNAMGFRALYNAVNGNYNNAMGYQAGSFEADGTTPIVAANDSIFIGKNARGVNASTNQIVIGDSAIGLGSNTTVIGSSATTETHLMGTLIQRNGINAQTHNIYNTDDGAGNYERAHIGWNDTNNTFVIGTESAGTGVDRDISINAGLVSLQGASEMLRLSDINAANDAATRNYFTYYRGANANRVGYSGFSGENTFEISTDFSAGRFRLRTGNQVEALLVDSSGSAAFAGNLGINGVTPPAQEAHIADPSGGATVDAESRTAINAILVALENIGITAAV